MPYLAIIKKDSQKIADEVRAGKSGIASLEEKIENFKEEISKMPGKLQKWQEDPVKKMASTREE